MSTDTLTRAKLVLEVVLLAAFLLLFVHIMWRDGRHAALSLVGKGTPGPT